MGGTYDKFCSQPPGGECAELSCFGFAFVFIVFLFYGVHVIVLKLTTIFAFTLSPAAVTASSIVSGSCLLWGFLGHEVILKSLLQVVSDF